jgi:hypothetical protein
MALTGIILVWLGIVIIVVGVALAVRNELRSSSVDAQAESITGLTKLAEALRGFQLGIQLVFLGFVAILIGAALAGVAIVF